MADYAPSGRVGEGAGVKAMIVNINNYFSNYWEQLPLNSSESTPLAGMIDKNSRHMAFDLIRKFVKLFFF